MNEPQTMAHGRASAPPNLAPAAEPLPPRQQPQMQGGPPPQPGPSMGGGGAGQGQPPMPDRTMMPAPQIGATQPNPATSGTVSPANVSMFTQPHSDPMTGAPSPGPNDPGVLLKLLTMMGQTPGGQGGY